MDIHEGNLSWSAVNTARSALSSFIHVNNSPVGRHPDVIRLMKGLFNRKPPRPRYTDIWDVRSVLNKLRQWSPCKFLSLKQLTLKLVMLMSLLTLQRGQTLHLIDLENCVRKKSRFVISIVNAVKTTRPGVPLPVLELESYPVDRRLDVVTVLDEYISRTKQLRPSPKGRLLLTYVKPHRPISRGTLSRWIKTVLVLSGIANYGSHSTRAAASSAALSGNVPVQDILKKAGWSNEKTFARFYQKPIKKKSMVSHAILQA